MRNKAVSNNKNNIYRKQRKCKRIIMARQTDKVQSTGRDRLIQTNLESSYVKKY